jgi:hypothetical protein
MKRTLTFLAALCALLVCAAEGAGSPVVGAWQVADLYCAVCTTEDRSEVGMKIRFGPTSIDDPLSGGCPAQVGYRALAPSPEAERGWRKRIAPRWLEGAPAAGKIEFVAATCRGLDVVLLARLSASKLVYLMEGEISFLLEPVREGAQGATPE